jgi:hypothetical protein
MSVIVEDNYDLKSNASVRVTLPAWTFFNRSVVKTKFIYESPKVL